MRVVGLLHPASFTPIHPFSLVYEENGARRMLQPWIDRRGPLPARAAITVKETPRPRDPIGDHLSEVAAGVGDLLCMGVGRTDSHTVRWWKAILQRSAALGFHRWLEPISRLVQAMQSRAHQPHVDPATLVPAALDLTVLTYLAQEAWSPESDR
jgi:hypothetical protein